MKEKLVEFLNKKGIKIVEEKFEQIVGDNEELDGTDNILYYELDGINDEFYMIYQSTCNIYYQNGMNVELVQEGLN